MLGKRLALRARAALVKEANPALTPAEMRAVLTTTARDIEAVGIDRDSGAGLVDALAAVQAALELERVQLLASFIGRSLQYKLLYEPLDTGLVFAHRQMECHAFATRHRLRQSYDFVFREKAKRRFLADVAERLGVPAGPERRRLLAGESIRSQSRQKVPPHSFPKPHFARPLPQQTPEAPSSLILSCLSRSPWAALRLAAGRCGGLPRRAADA